jgi:hypothetical protein
MNKSDTIFTRGFLSTQIAEFRQGYRQLYADLFAICEEKAETATARLFDADFSAFNDGKDRHVLLGLGFWCRCVRACQGALVLLERGMVPEAQILIRSAYEFMFVGAASVIDKSVLDQLIAKDQEERKKQANAMITDCPALTSDGIEKLREIIERDSEGVGVAFNAFNAAQKTGLKELYATVYRGMSLIASHEPTACSSGGTTS